MATRIIAGEFKGLPLAVPKGLVTRPTSAKVREAVMGALSDRIQGARVLDLYAGSGAMGLEALSRGAQMARLVDRSVAAVAAMRRNVDSLPAHLKDSVTIHRLVLPGQIKRLSSLGSVDLFFLDPPYSDVKGPLAVLTGLASLAAPNAVAVWEQDPRSFDLWGPEHVAPWTVESRRRWGDRAAAFLRPPGAGNLDTDPDADEPGACEESEPEEESEEEDEGDDWENKEFERGD